MALATLSIDLVAKIASFEKDLGKATRSAESNADKINAAFAGVKGGLAGLAAGVSVAGLVSFAKTTIDSIDALNDLKDATGASVENLSALEDVAARSGTSMDTVSGGLIKFNQVLGDAKPDSNAARALAAIGLNAEELKQIDPAEALHQTAVALAGFADDGNRARLVQELFGKSTKEVAAFLKDLAEQGKLVGTVTKEQADEAEKFNKQLFALQKNAQDVARELAGPMLEAFKYLTVAGANVTYVLKTTGNEIGGIAAQAVALANLDFKGFSAISDAMHEDATKARKELDELQARILAGASVAQAAAINPRLLRQGAYDKPSVGDTPDRPTKTTSGTTKDPYAEVNRYIEGARKKIQATQDLTAVQQLGMEINDGNFGKMSAQTQQTLIGWAQRIDAAQAQTEAEKELTKALEDRMKAEIASLTQIDEGRAALLASLLASTPTVQFAAQQADLAALQEAFADGAISQELYAEAVAERFDLNNVKIEQTKTLAEDLGLTFASAAEEAIVNWQGLESVLAGLEQDILRIVTRKLVIEPMGNALTGMLGNAMGGSGGMIGGDLGNALADLIGFNFDGGGYTGNAARSGGLDGKGGFMAMMHPQETVVDHTKGQRVTGGNSVTVNITQQFAPGTTRQTTLQAAADASRQLQYAGRNL